MITMPLSVSAAVAPDQGSEYRELPQKQVPVSMRPVLCDRIAIVEWSKDAKMAVQSPGSAVCNLHPRHNAILHNGLKIVTSCAVEGSL